MKILVLSDTHGDISNSEHILKFYSNAIDMVFHLGDHDGDAKVLQKLFPELQFHIVSGNNDFFSGTPANKMVFANGKKLLLTHGHKQRVNWNYNTISYWAEEQGADMVLFGHTHAALNEKIGNVLVFNPGSIYLPRDTRIPTFGLIAIEEDGTITSVVMEYHSEKKFLPRN